MSESKIKVIHLVSDLGIGGVQKVVLDICSSADLEKYKISIFTLGPSSDLVATYLLPPEIEIRYFNYEYSTDYSLIGYFKHTFFTKEIAAKGAQIIDALVTEKPTILHLHIHPRELNLGILVQKKTNCELVYTQHLLRLNPGGFSLKLLGYIFRKTFHKYHIVAVSQSTYDEIIQYKLLGSDKILALIENKLNLKLFHPLSKKTSDFISIVYVARIGAPKAHSELIVAWSKLNDSIKKKLILVGPDELNGEMQRLAAKLVPDKSIVFTGPKNNITEILCTCDFAVFPSHKEGLPIALLEKMAMGLPVIVSSIPELTSVVKDNINGLVFECGNADDLAKKISLLLADSELREFLGHNARKTIAEKYGSENIALPNELLYEKIIRKSVL